MSRVHRQHGGAALYSVHYGARDALGRIVSKTETVQGVTHVYGYAYDSRGRLTDVTTDGAPSSHYEYDANGNRLVGPGLTASPVYDAQDRMTSYGSCTYAYKAAGSLQAKTCPDGTTLYDYDAFGNRRSPQWRCSRFDGRATAEWAARGGTPFGSDISAVLQRALARVHNARRSLVRTGR